MNLKPFALLFGIVLTIMGIIGFIPIFSPHGLLLGIFAVDPVHNIIHLITGILAFLSLSNIRYMRLYFQVIGVIYAILAVAGLLFTGNFFVTQMNMADQLLHIVIAIFALYLGFFIKKANK